VSGAAAGLARLALEAGAIQLRPDKPFTWASGYRMPVYNDNRLLLGRPEARRAIAEAFAGMVREEARPFDLVAGTATAGIPHATTLADLLGLPLCYVRSKAKEHGAGNLIEGLAAGAGLSGRRVVLVEDLVSTGGSSIKAVEALRQAGADCSLCLAIFSYGFRQGRDAFEALNPPCRLKTILTYGQLLPLARESGYLKESDMELLREWDQDPFGWGQKHGFPREAA
jgi:orotate phosphoribosyltransferase